MNSLRNAAFTLPSPYYTILPLSPQTCRRRPIQLSITPSRRTIALSTLIGTSVISAATGGPWLAACGALFVGIGVATEAPVGLMGVAATICASLADLLLLNAGSSALDSGLWPFAIFLLGSIAAGVTDASSLPPALEQKQEEEVHVLEEESDKVDEFAKWDNALRKRREKDET